MNIVSVVSPRDQAGSIAGILPVDKIRFCSLLLPQSNGILKLSKGQQPTTKTRTARATTVQPKRSGSDADGQKDDDQEHR